MMTPADVLVSAAFELLPAAKAVASTQAKVRIDGAHEGDGPTCRPRDRNRRGGRKWHPGSAPASTDSRAGTKRCGRDCTIAWFGNNRRPTHALGRDEVTTGAHLSSPLCSLGEEPQAIR